MKIFNTILVLICSFAACLLSALSSLAADATFSWTPNNPDPSGYKIYYGIESGNYNMVVDVSFPTAVDGQIIKTVTELEEGQTYYFAATAYSETEESGYTDEVVYTVPATPGLDPPVASNISLQGNEDSLITGQLLVETTTGADLVFSVISGPANGTLTIEDDNGTFSYTPSPDFSGVDTFSYTARNDVGSSAAATVTLTLSPISDLPVANNGSFTVSEDGNYSGTLSATDIDGDRLSYSLDSQSTKGQTTINQDGSFTYIPYADTSGIDSFTFKAKDDSSDSNIATINIKINSINDIPVANSISISLNEDSVYSGQLTASDVDGNTLTYALVAQSTRGSVIISQSGSFTYTPSQNVSGSDSFTFIASDSLTQSQAATVAITINSENDTPVANSLSISLNENSSYSGQLLASDLDKDSLSYNLVSQASEGVVSVDSTGFFSYTPETNYSGDDVFTFSVSDGSTVSNIATVSLVISEVAHEFNYELGELQVSAEWIHIDFETEFISPAVIVNPTTSNSADAVLVTIRNLTNLGFDIRLNTWASGNVTDQTDMVTYLAMEQGYHEVEDNIHVLADCTAVSGINSFQTVAFSSALPSVPVVLSSIVTDNDADGVTLRLKDINQYGFSAAMQEQENSDLVHSEESICYIAMEEWYGMIDDMLVEIISTPNSLTDSESTHLFTQQFPSLPFVYAGLQSSNGMDTATLSISKIAVDKMNLKVLEEQSADTEVNHVSETGGYFAIVPYLPSEDCDHDGLSNIEEKAFYTHPGLTDSDQDGINDGDELQYLLDNTLEASIDSDEDGIINLLDSDSDNDGVLDGSEIAQGSDPIDPYSIPGSGASSFVFEVGEMLVGHELVHIEFTSTFSEPVIIANAVTRNDSEPFVIGISNVTSEGFDVKIREYNYQDGIHPQEIISYSVMEKGSYVLDDGSLVEAGTFEANGDISEVLFEADFSSAPVVFTSTVSTNDINTVAGRTGDVNSSGFMHYLRREEANGTKPDFEMVAYMAWTPGITSANGVIFEAGTTPDSVTHKDYEIQLSQDFNNLPFHFAGMQTMDGKDTSLAKITHAEESSMTVRIEEEQSKNSETRHTKEIVGFLIVAPE